MTIPGPGMKEAITGVLQNHDFNSYTKKEDL